MSAIKLLLYLVTTVIVVAFLYVGVVYAIVNQTLQQETFDNCMKVFGTKSFSSFDLCLKQRTGITLPIWLYLIPYLPAGLLWWLSWSLNINLHLSINTYPKRIVVGLVWLGLIAAAYAIILTFWIAIYLIDKPSSIILLPTIVLSGWLIAPLLFQHLLAPVEAVRHMSVLKIGLVLMLITPVIAVSFSFINATIEALLTKSSIIN
ncbi:MAG: hypothetical protein O7D95_00715 [Betaproteobacteria bacterium]|nr:hypothetical protein [Betaproteobacteria bacterium]